MASSLRFNVTANDGASSTFAAVAAQAQALASELDRLDRRIRIKVALDAPSAAEVRAIGASINDLDGKTVRAKVRIDAPSSADLAAVQAARAALDGIDGRNARARASISAPSAAEVARVRDAANALQALDGRNATARVRIEAPSSADLARIAAAATALRDLDGRNANGTVTITSNIGAAEVRQLKAAAKAIRELDGQNATVAVQFTGNLPDARELRAAARALKQLQDVSPVTIVIRVIGPLEALAAIAALSAALRSLPENTSSRVKVDVDKPDRVLQMAAGLLKIGGAGGVAAAGAITAAAGVASLAGSLATLAGLTPVAVAGVVAGGAAFAALKVGLSGMGDALKETDPKKFAEALKGLAPSAQQFATSVRDIGPAWKSVKLDTQQKLFADLGGEMKKLSATYLPSVKSGLGLISGGFNGMAKDLVGFATSAGTVKDVDTIFRNTATAVQAARPGVVNLATAFRDIATVGSQMLPELAGGFTQVTSQFAAFIGRARESGQLKEWIQQGVDTLQTLGSIAGNVGTSLGAVFTAAKASGADFLGTLDQVTAKIATLLTSSQGQAALTAVFTEARAAIDGLLPGLEAAATGVLQMLQSFANTGAVQNFARVVSDIATTLAPLGATIGKLAGDALNGLANGAAVAMGPLSALVGGVSGVASALGPLPGLVLAAVVAFKGLSVVSGVFVTMSAAMTRAAQGLAFMSYSSSAFAGAAGAGSRAASGLSTVLSKMGTALPLIGVALIGIGAAADAASVDFDGLVQKVASGALTLTQAIQQAQTDASTGWAGFVNGFTELTTGMDIGAATAEKMRQKFDEFRASLGPMAQLELDVKTAQTELNDAVAQFGANSPQAVSAASRLAAAQAALKAAHDGAANAAKSQAEREQELADKMKSQISVALQYAAAVKATADAQKEADAAIKEHGADSDEAKTAVLNLAGAMAQQADAARQQAAAWGGNTAGLAAMNTELLKTATQSPASRAAFAQLAAGLDQAGLDALSATARMSGLRTEVMTLPDGRKVTVVVAADAGKLPDVKQQLTDIANKEWIGTVTIKSTSENARGDIQQVVQFANGQTGTINIFADGRPSIATINGVKYQIDATTGTLKVLSDVAPGQANLNGFKLQVDATTGTMKIVGDPAQLFTSLAGAKGQVDSSIGTMKIDGEPTLVNGKIEASVQLANGSTGTIIIDGNKTNADGKIEAVIRYADGSTGTVLIEANDQASPVIAAIPREITTIVNIVTRGNAQVFTPRAGSAGGGIVGYAGGGLVKPRAFTRGGVLSGYQPGRDTVPAVLSRGEAVLVPELVRQLGARRILAANSEASGGRPATNTGRIASLMDGRVPTMSQIRSSAPQGMSAIRRMATIPDTSPRGAGISAGSGGVIAALVALERTVRDELRDGSDIAHGDATMTARNMRALVDGIVSALAERSDATASGARQLARLGLHANG